MTRTSGVSVGSRKGWQASVRWRSEAFQVSQFALEVPSQALPLGSSEKHLTLFFTTNTRTVHTELSD